MRRTAVVVAIALLGGCGGSSKPPAPTPAPSPRPRPPDARELLQDALDRRARATQRSRRTAGLGLRDVELTLDGLGPSRVTARLRYRVRGVQGTFGSRREFRRAGRRLGAATGTRGRPPWEVDAYERSRTPHFVIWAPQGLATGTLTQALEEGYARMREVLASGRLRRRYLVVVARDAAAARRLTSRIRGLDGLTALTDTEVRQTGEALRVAEVTSQRLLVVFAAFGTLDVEAQRITVAHELTHAALAPQTSGRVPGWLSEGLAMYVSSDRRSIEASRLLAEGQALALRRLSEPDAVGRLSGPRQGAAYAYSSAAAHHIADRYGRGRLLRLYDVFNREGLRGEAGDPELTDRATRRVLGVGLARLERDVREALGAF